MILQISRMQNIGVGYVHKLCASIYIFFSSRLQLLDVVCSDVDQLMSCFLIKGEGRSRQSASIQPPFLCYVCVCAHQCGLCVVCGDEESLPRSERHVGSLPWAWACVFITPTPQKTKVGVVC